jgi:hypothetical protein
MKPFKNITILSIFIFLILFQKGECLNGPAVYYEHTRFVDNAYLAFDLLADSGGGFGVFDEFNILKIRSGVRKTKGIEELSYLYDFSLVDYVSIFRMPIVKNEFVGLILDEPILNWDYSTFITFSYKGPEISNLGIYEKDYNWSSVGIDLLYKHWKPSLATSLFYSRFSYILTPSTIQNNRNYFSNIDNSLNKNFCLETKILNTTKLSKHSHDIDNDFILETYYRKFYNGLKQYEFSTSLKYKRYSYKTPLIFSCQLGYLRYGVIDKWNDILVFNLGIGYNFD